MLLPSREFMVGWTSNLGVLMMAGYVDFEEVLDLLESHGWKLQKI